MESNELISVIVPIYNVELYLEKCIVSIINQTYKNLEIILVNDGSPDNCPQICEEYAKKDSRIKVIHKKNGGLSDARNYGIDIANGKYLCFIDSDDYIADQMIEKLYQNLKKNKSDISICNFYETYSNDYLKFYPFPEKKLKISGNAKFYNIYNKYFLSTIAAWGKLYKKEIFNNIKYPLGKIHEDEAIITEVLKNAKVISYFDEPLYYYVQREKSITKIFDLKRLDIIEVHEKRLEFFNRIEPTLLKLEYMSYVKGLTKIIIPGLKKIHEQEKYKFYVKRKKQLISALIKNFQLTKKEKLEILLIRFFPKMYIIICNQTFIKKLIKK